MWRDQSKYHQHFANNIYFIASSDFRISAFLVENEKIQYDELYFKHSFVSDESFIFAIQICLKIISKCALWQRDCIYASLTRFLNSQQVHVCLPNYKTIAGENVRN